MRTTLTIDEDLAIAIDREVKSTGRSLKETVNTLLRQGLAASRSGKAKTEFRVIARDLGRRPGVTIGKIDDLLDEIEGPMRS